MLQTVHFDNFNAIRDREPQWNDMLSRYKQRDNFNDMFWYRLRINMNDTAPLVIACLQDDTLKGFMPCEQKKVYLKLSLTGRKILKFPFSAANVFGNNIVGKQQKNIYSSIFSYFFNELTDYELLCLSQVPIDSFLYRYIHSSPEIKKQYIVYHPLPDTPRYFVDLSDADSAQEFIATLNKKRMRNLRRLKKKLQDKLGYEVQAERFVNLDRTEELFKKSEKISKITWQNRVLGSRIGYGDLSLDFLQKVASKGWLRSYILSCGNNLLSFLIAFQFNDCLYLREMGYDPSWSSYSPGNLLWMLVFQDLFERDTPSKADFGYGDADFKRSFSNMSYQETSLYLFRKTFRNKFLLSFHRNINLIIYQFSNLSEKLGFKRLLKNLIRKV